MEDSTKETEDPFPGSTSEESREEDSEMEKMLSELTSIVPPTSAPPDWSLGSGDWSDPETSPSEDNGYVI